MADRTMAKSTIQVDDRAVRATEWRFAPGAHTGWHRHEFDYVVVPLTTGELHMADRDENTRTASLTKGSSYAGTAGTEHDVINPNAFEFVFIEIELISGRHSR